MNLFIRNSVFNFIIAVIIIIGNYSCYTKTDSTLIHQKKIWQKLNETGDYDSLIKVATPYYLYSIKQNDTLSILNSSVILSQSYLLMEELDSALLFLNRTEDYFSERQPYLGIGALMYNIKGILNIKNGYNYSQSLYFFKKGLDCAQKSNNIEYQIVILVNISNLCYIREDSGGLEYAEMALKLLSDNSDIGDFSKIQAFICASQMLYLNKQYSRSEEYITKALSIINQGNYDSFKSICYLILSDLNSNNLFKASKYYNEALKYCQNTSPLTLILIYLKYGMTLESNEKYSDALKIYFSGLDLSKQINSFEFRIKLLKHISATYYSIGDTVNGEKYTNYYTFTLDSLSLSEKEQNFSEDIADFNRLKYTYELQKKEINLLKANKKIMRIVSILSIIVIIAFSIILLFIKQRKMYKLLVVQHQAYLNKYLENKTLNSVDSHAYNTNLFHKIESLMKTEKLYKDTDLSLEKISELLQTNRTYISKAINDNSGTNFYSYLDHYRIRESTLFLSDPGCNLTLKQISAEVGYKSLQVFYRAFKKEMGCAPGYYRNTALKIKSKHTNTDSPTYLPSHKTP